MGAINYGKSHVLCTVGYYQEDPTDDEVNEFMFYNDVTDFEEAKKMVEENYEEVSLDYYKDVRHLLQTLSLSYYAVSVEQGYYDGFYIDIQDRSRVYNMEEERKEQMRELTGIRTILASIIINYPMRVCYPHWSTNWEETIDKSIAALDKAVEEEKKRLTTKKTELWDLEHTKELKAK